MLYLLGIAKLPREFSGISEAYKYNKLASQKFGYWESALSLSVVGIFHTIFGLFALISAAWLIVTSHQIDIKQSLGKLYVLSTAITAATALFIFNHGGFNIAHGLAVLTLLALLAGILLSFFKLFGKATAYLQLISMSSTLLFHLLPTATEVLTRFPMSEPLAKSLEDPILQKTFLIILVLFLIMLSWQLLWLKRRNVYIHH